MANITSPALLARDDSFRDRALIAALQEAVAVLDEPEDTPGHTHRVGYAQSIIKSPEAYQPTVVWVLAAAFGLDPTYADQPAELIPDEAMGVVLHNMWNALSQPA